MAPARGTKPDPAGRLGGFGRFAGFAIVAGMAFALLATVVGLPAAARLDKARADCDALAYHTAAYAGLIDYRGELIDAIKTDPLQTERLLMAQRNYRRPGEAVYAIDAPADPPILEAIQAQLPAPRPASATLATLSRRVQRPPTRRGLLLLSGLLLVLATVMFLPPGPETPR